MKMTDEDFAKRIRIKKLEEELRNLKEETGISSSSEEYDYNGTPMIRIHGKFKPFSLSVKKAKAVIELINDLNEFISKNDTKDD